MQPDLALVRRYLKTQAIPGRLVLCAITGSHAYGFSSPDSDLDIKGIHLAPVERVLGLGPVEETVDHIEWFEGAECDLTTHEAAKAASLLLRGNGNLLERLTSPFQVIDTPEGAALRALVPQLVSRKSYHHYAGYMRGRQAEHGRVGRVKSMLYVFRVGLTGIHLLRTGEVVAHLPTLAPIYGFSDTLELVALKAEGAEKATLDPAISARFEARWPALEAALGHARDHSPLPEEPRGREALDRWLINARLAGRTG